MNGFTAFMARLKVWQFFILLVLPMFASQFYLTSNMPSPAYPPRPPGIEEFEAFFQQIMLMTLLMVVLLLTWLLSIGIEANRRVGENLRLSTRLAIGCAFYATSYIAIAPFIFPGLGPGSPSEVSMGIVVPLFLMWFFPIGVWFVQPRVNRLIAGS